MVEYDKLGISEGIDINKNTASKERGICHYWYFSDKNFKYEPYLCNGCHDLTQKAIIFNDLAIVSIKGGDYRIHFWYRSKGDAMNIMQNCNVSKKSGSLYIYIILLYIKMSERTYYQRNRETVLNRAKYYFEKTKEVLREKAKKRKKCKEKIWKK